MQRAAKSTTGRQIARLRPTKPSSYHSSATHHRHHPPSHPALFSFSLFIFSPSSPSVSLNHHARRCLLLHLIRSISLSQLKDNHSNSSHGILARPPVEPHEAGMDFQAQHRHAARKELPSHLHHLHNRYVKLSPSATALGVVESHFVWVVAMNR